MKKERLYEKLEDYKRASKRLDEAIKLEIHHDIIYDAVIQRFEFTFELSWKLMKMFLEYVGVSEIKSPRATIREAFTYGLIEDGDEWIDMMIDRNKTSHIYNEEEAKLIYMKIKNRYNDLFKQLADKIEKEINNI
ncbi:nucleotidyltransferase substrate binding protein (TIGR01987 family) [Thermolongibacillus altinsuensis]|uniref:Nucleotidyltransferase substrate binding protein (TIGR01987 family) n=1 Tax=Thermolongibacillus altinsuensis TaxID=575256 RepID=A0A4R1Q996_9BACL|nr:nucleotidyltransferase substrate binding protein [Thermolongibacillus altinsuensis]TCL44777.1 nucleotidyltransferase substrate binding protein (TIGR01987 family) [Thermolongibacillus altinsuensis]